MIGERKLSEGKAAREAVAVRTIAEHLAKQEGREKPKAADYTQADQKLDFVDIIDPETRANLIDQANESYDLERALGKDGVAKLSQIVEKLLENPVAVSAEGEQALQQLETKETGVVDKLIGSAKVGMGAQIDNIRRNLDVQRLFKGHDGLLEGYLDRLAEVLLKRFIADTAQK